VPMPYAEMLEAAALPTVEDVIEAAKKAMNMNVPDTGPLTVPDKSPLGTASAGGA